MGVRANPSPARWMYSILGLLISDGSGVGGRRDVGPDAALQNDRPEATQRFLREDRQRRGILSASEQGQ